MSRITLSPIDIQIGKTIRDRRVALGLTQSELGGAIGVSFQQVQKYERGANRVAASTLLQVAGALRCSVADLYGDPVLTGQSPSERAILKLWSQLNQKQSDAVAAMLQQFLTR
ncbi:helix-turn-helix domain-containing protein [Brevundimonas sp. KM4]|jgi:transcriptional regulator with XRE-family HTH domain|uniref:helix-turn-helix domain-containing protein n=1 Tax=Brevundimonas sp. KM4 TaxID=1628191 RepID=UPI0009E4A43A|nr:helix-turn-helix transcriptional regulator [Brevundimonas sp. KM4]